MLVDRWVSVGLMAAGLLMVAVGQTADFSDHDQISLTFVGFDCALFSIAGLLFPRSNNEFKLQAVSFFQFFALAIATFGALALLVYIAFGSPNPVGDEVFTTSLTIGLAGGLIIPILAKQLTLKVRNKQ